ncbi:hypothetical protein AnigIFM50267_008620 [Aspergillus niger]|nr:hypothetical protein AnigIFM50267_008620 [Aspergillus niger]GLA20049.1 hypothetical protein AnigIFM62618_008175 [Aspergillus niger]
MKLAPVAAVALPVLAAHAAPLAESTCQKTEVVILGAGVAGLTAAKTLADHNVNDFVVLEYQDRVGGRLHNVTFAKHTVEAGANWVHGPGTPEGHINPIWTMVQKAGLKTVTTDEDDNSMYDHTGPTDYSAVFERAENANKLVFADAGDILKSNYQDRTHRAGLRLQDWNPAKNDPAAQLADWFIWDWDAAAPPEVSSEVFGTISINATYNYFSHSDEFICDPQGYVHAVWEDVKFAFEGHPERLRLRTKVTEIKHDADSVTVTSADGHCVTAKYAIVTFSVGVLQKKDAVRFIPELPAWKTRAIAGFEMGTYIKVFLEFETSFWDAKQFLLYADPHVRGNYPIFQPLDLEGLYPGSNILVATVIGEIAYRIESQSNEETAAQIIQVLENMYGKGVVSTLKDISYTRWDQEDWSYGSYSYWPPSTSLQAHQNMRANVDSVFFAGEATSQEFFGYVQGGYYEGKHVAEFLVGCLTAPDPEQCALNPDQKRYPVLTGVTPYDMYNPENGWYIYDEDLGVPGHA